MLRAKHVGRCFAMERAQNGHILGTAGRSTVERVPLFRTDSSVTAACLRVVATHRGAGRAHAAKEVLDSLALDFGGAAHHRCAAPRVARAVARRRQLRQAHARAHVTDSHGAALLVATLCGARVSPGSTEGHAGVGSIRRKAANTRSSNDSAAATWLREQQIHAVGRFRARGRDITIQLGP